MSRWPGELRAWLDERWNGLERTGTLLAKPLPRNISWIHTLGALLLTYLVFQLVTGILLGLYYTPSPEGAYESVAYIDEELFLGRFLHQLHRYGSGFVIVAAFLHMMRSYFLSAYKAPRELLWVSGVLLLVLLTLFAFTGQLLPYDQRGYWATVVGIKIASSAPVLGESVRALLTGGYGEIGAATLSRFYVVHICLLPLLLAALIAMHLGILQKVGSAPPTREPPEPYRPFFPWQAAKDALVSVTGALALVLVAAFVRTADTGPADPTSSGFVPRPEWYFYAHYTMLRLLPPGLQILGTFVLPNAALAALLLLPFLDRGRERDPRKRPLFTGVGALACLAVVGLTIAGVVDAARDPAGFEPQETAAISDPVEHGEQLWLGAMECHTCHTVHGEGGTTGPDLSNVGRRLRPDYLRAWIRNPKAFDPDTEMPRFEGTEQELDAVVQYLLTLQ